MRALFAAYDQVLAERNLESEHDQIYFRFLLRMRDVDSSDGTLFGKFETLLGRLGIHIEGEGVEEITRNLDEAPTSEQVESARAGRRASFSTLYQSDAAPERPLPHRRHKRSSSRASVDGRISRSRGYYQHRLPSQLPTRGWMNVRSASDIPRALRKRNTSVSSLDSLKISRQLPTDHEYRSYSADESDALSSPRWADNEHGAHHHIPAELLYRPSTTQMHADAETFLYHKTSIASRRCLRIWCNKASELADQHKDMEARAHAYDREIILRQPFDIWRVELQRRRQEAELERFFASREEKASKARDLFLLTKAFTHWAQLAVDEIQRTSVARRHIIRTKYFNAWRDITAVNELKIRRFALKKYFNTWRQHNAVILERNGMAVAHYCDNLAYRVYWQWFWSFCDRRAPQWHQHHLQQKVYLRWLDIVRQTREREAWVERMRMNDVRRKILSHLSAAAQFYRIQTATAEQFRRQNLLAKSLSVWNKQAKLGPLLAQHQQVTNARRVQVVLARWSLAADMSVAAGRLRGKLLMHSTLQNWRDNLAVSHVSFKIDSRVLKEAYYRWRLAAQAAAVAHLRDARIARHAFQSWVLRTVAHQEEAMEAEQKAMSFRRTQVLRRPFRQLLNAAQQSRQQATLALSRYEPRLLEVSFRKWASKAQQILENEEAAVMCDFWVTAKPALKRWQEALKAKRKLQRRDAYAQVRRHNKMALVQRNLHVWRQRTVDRQENDQKARDFQDRHLSLAVASHFRAWSIKTSLYVDDLQRAESFYVRINLRQKLAKWRAREQQVQQMEAAIPVFKIEHLASAALSSLRKLSWRLFEVQRHEQNALALRDKHWDRHVRNMLSYWSERTIVARETRNAAPSSPSPRAIGSTRMDVHDQIIARAEEWTAFDESALNLGNLELDLDLSLIPDGHDGGAAGMATSTPLPGYMRTPSKRTTARARARQRLQALSQTAPPESSSMRTPGGAITPFQQRLRAMGYSAGRFPGRTPATRGFAGFEDIAERSEGSGR